jgi:hypothetical protein
LLFRNGTTATNDPLINPAADHLAVLPGAGQMYRIKSFCSSTIKAVIRYFSMSPLHPLLSAGFSLHNEGSKPDCAGINLPDNHPGQP